MIETVSVLSYRDYQNQGEITVLKGIAPEVKELQAKGKGVLIVDDLVDTGKTARVVRDMLAEGAFRHGLRKADGSAIGGHLHHRSVAGHLDLFSMGYGARVPAADPRGEVGGLNISHRFMIAREVE